VHEQRAVAREVAGRLVHAQPLRLAGVVLDHEAAVLVQLHRDVAGQRGRAQAQRRAESGGAESDRAMDEG
jgi:hypothetical protein